MSTAPFANFPSYLRPRAAQSGTQVLASILANALCHAAHLEDGGVGERAPKMSRPPLHAMLVWKYITAHATSFAVCAAGEEEPSRWAGWRRNIIALGGDPNWRSRPSPLDEVKGRIPSRRPWRAGQKMLSAPRQRSKPKMAAK